MNRKFIITGLLMILCTATIERIIIADEENEVWDNVCNPFLMSSQLSPKTLPPSFNNTDNIICPKSLPVYCTSKNAKNKRARCLSETYFLSWNKDTQQEFIIENNYMFEGDKIVTCQMAENFLDLTPDEFYLMASLGYTRNNPHDTVENQYQCILIGHRYKEKSTEEIRYFKAPPALEVTTMNIKNKTGFQKFDSPGQMHYDFFSCSPTKEGIIEAKQWYENQKPWYQKWNEKVKQWYKNYLNTWKFWFVIISLIVILLGVIGLCVCYCCGNHRVEQEEGAVELVGNDVSDSSLSKSDFVIELSDLESMQISLTNSTGEYSAETINSIIPITDSTKSHSTDDLSFSSEVELTEKLQDSEDSHHSQSKIKVHETEDLHHSQSKTKVQESKDTPLSQSKTNAQEQPEEKYHSNSESDFSI